MMENLPLSRSEALELIAKHNTDPSDINHYLESEAVMRALARALGEDEENWAMLGLLHDIDWGITKHNLAEHLTKAPEILRAQGFDEGFIETVLSHGYGTVCAGLQEKKRSRKAEHALACSETITGLIHAYALMRGTMVGMGVKGLKKKFKDKKFAAGVEREIIQECDHLGIPLDDFFHLAIGAIEEIASDVGIDGGNAG